MFARALILLLALAAPASAQSLSARPDPAFDRFLSALRTDALAKGISRTTFDRAFAGVTPDPRVVAATKRQPEYNKPAGAYIDGLASPQRTTQGARKAIEWRPTLDAIEQKFGVDRHVMLAIWGMETSFGDAKDKWDVVRSLASLAFVRYRDDFFRDELLTALTILQQGHVPREKFMSSWAGAMGQPQFMPSSFLKAAVDFDGDGRRDIWTSVPDVLASIANYLRNAGWKPGLGWGYEVTIPKDFDLMRSRASFAQWAALGVRPVNGRAYPKTGDGILFFPAGADGPGFVITENFHALRDYNNSDVYAISIGHLADRMRGGKPLRGPWPNADAQLPRDDRVALQRKLAERGHPVTLFNGPITFDQRDFIRKEQVALGMRPDGHPTRALLDAMGISRTQ